MRLPQKKTKKKNPQPNKNPQSTRHRAARTSAHCMLMDTGAMEAQIHRRGR